MRIAVTSRRDSISALISRGDRGVERTTGSYSNRIS